MARKKPEAHLPQLAVSLHNLSVRMGRLGRHEEALAAAAEAVQIRRELARKKPDAHLLELVSSLHNLSAALGYLGRQEEALASTMTWVR
ncbi:tetratricopeptide repeat protein [Streptomyces sp. NPDC001315]|uniref:tetratricopeptide repeat protein n=1 Tax=Streptomyces sp. NPDC001315 TaxID=3364562 RepID=UPI0036AD3010